MSQVLDAGWPMFIGALALLCAAMLIPTVDEYKEAAWQRDRALAAEREKQQRILNHERYLAALDRGDLDLIRALAESQLNSVPSGYRVLFASSFSSRRDASVFEQLEPEPVPEPEHHMVGSLLQRLATSSRTRPWVLGVGVILLALGLMPPTRRP